MLKGRVLYVSAERNWLGEVRPSESVEIPVRVQNLTSGPLKLLGSSTTCSCAVVGGKLPIELAPGEIKEFLVALRAPETSPTDFNYAITFYVNVVDEQAQAILSGRVVAGPQ